VLVSMTGFCSRNENVSLMHMGNVAVTVELKSLNGRFFEAMVKLPSLLSHLEIPLTALLQENLLRGKVYLVIKLEVRDGVGETIIPCWPIINQYTKLSADIIKQSGVSGQLTLSDLIQLPNVFISKPQEITSEDDRAIIDLVTTVAKGLVKSRQEEGARLVSAFGAMLEVCRNKIEQVSSLFETEVTRYKALVKDAMQAHAGSEQPNVVVEELQQDLKKMDIHEEITRITSHLASVTVLFNAASIEKGKRFDFILQELLRETNTIMAKCSLYQISALCIDIKVELEKAREQIQNIV